MPDIEIEGFYNKGVDAYVVSKGFNNSTFTNEDQRTYVGVKPHPASKVTSDPKWEIISYRGEEYLALNKGYQYSVKFKKGKKSVVIDATKEHTLWPLPFEYVVDKAEPKEWANKKEEKKKEKKD